MQFWRVFYLTFHALSPRRRGSCSCAILLFHSRKDPRFRGDKHTVNELLFEYYYDKQRLRTCLSCKHYFKHMNKYDVYNIMQSNSLNDRKPGQKFCLKNKCFVYFSDCCGFWDLGECA
jgi:hypothetical protein